MHQWAVRWNEVTYQPDETSFCSYYMGLFLNPLHVKELSQTSAGGFLSSITQGPNEIASSVRATIRSQSNKSKHGNETSVDKGNSGSNENRNDTVNVDLQHQDGDVDRKLDSKPSFKRSSSSNKNDETKILFLLFINKKSGAQCGNSLGQRLNILRNPVQSVIRKKGNKKKFVWTRRLAQGQSIKIQLFAAFPVRVDGEPCTLAISHHGQVSLSLSLWAEEPLGHAAAIITDVLENAEPLGHAAAM
ncbi:hypothetical protein PRUPE_3G273400 [Prunus persica]|uniref:Uncharacterized protein n=1 Tax=Prunus persica TaxID=3760 RepID=A0A251Q6B2_PRUPE|nr:hypothetical protein PRUPE_3G273400 [Prunus persica]ONI19349.1 hypothetical protein PRUPE_3G273400 [Prunus persica]